VRSDLVPPPCHRLCRRPLVDYESGDKKTVYRKIEIDKSSELSLAMLVAMRTVETLRVSLLERHSPNRVSPKAISPESQRIVDERHFSPFQRLGLGISSGLMMSPGGAGIRAAFGASALVQPVRNLDVTVSANWSPPGGTYKRTVFVPSSRTCCCGDGCTTASPPTVYFARPSVSAPALSSEPPKAKPMTVRQ
jgi:hypothetical protein